MAEANRAIFDKLMIANELDFWNRMRDVRFHCQNLVVVSVNPGEAFLADAYGVALDVVDQHSAGMTGSQLKVDQPRWVAMPRGVTFAAKRVVGPVVGVKDQRERGKSDGSDVFWKSLLGNTAIPEFFHVKLIAGKLANFDKVLECSSFVCGLQPHGAEVVVVDLFGGRESIDVLNEFLHPMTCGSNDFAELAPFGGIEIDFLVVNIGRRPAGFHDGSHLRRRW